MGASIQINGVTQTVATVPYGSTVTLVNALPTGSAQRWEILDAAEDIDGVSPDYATNFVGWTLQGDGTLALNQPSSPFASVSFRPDVTGTYRVRLTSTETGAPVQTAVIRVVEAYTGETLPAAGESAEADPRRGWKVAFNIREKRTGYFFQGCVRAANTSGSSLARGQVVRLAGAVDAHAIPPATVPGGSTVKPEYLTTLLPADNTFGSAQHARYGVLEQALSNNTTGWVRIHGLFAGKTDVDYSGFTAGQRAYFGTTGTQTPTAPSPAIPIGTVLVAAAGTGMLWVDNTVHSKVTASVDGLMAATDKSLLDGLVSTLRNIKSFGAVGDGVHDDTTQIQAGLTAGGAILFPAGTYKITAALTMPNGVKIYGEGADITTIRQTSVTDCFTGANVLGCEINGMTLDGSTSTSAAHAGVWFTGNSERNRIQKCRFTHWSTAIRLHTDARYNVIADNKFDSWLTCPEDAANTIHSAYVHIAGTVLTIPNHCRGNWIVNNLFVGVSATADRTNANLAPRAILGTTSFTSNVIEGNIFNGWEGNCVVIGGATGDNNAVADENVIANNTFNQILTYTSRPIFLFNHCSRNQIIGNTAREIGGDGIHLTEQCLENVIANNVLFDCGRAIRDGILSIGTTNPGGIRIDGVFSPSYRNIIQGNEIIHCFSMGMSISNAAYVVVKGNTVHDCGVGDTSFGQGIIISAASAENGNYPIVEGNTISSIGSIGLQISGRCQQAIIKGNRFSCMSVTGAAYNTFDAVKLIVQDGVYPAGAHLEGNIMIDDFAFFGQATTRYAVNIDDGVTDAELRANDFSGVLQAARFRVGSGSTVYLAGNKTDSGAGIVETTTRKTDFVNGIKAATIAERTGGGNVTVSGMLVAPLVQIATGVERPDNAGIGWLFGNGVNTGLGRLAAGNGLGDHHNWGIEDPGLTLTTDGSLADAWSYRVPSNSVCVVRNVITAKRTNGTGEKAAFILTVVYDMNGANSGTPAVMGSDLKVLFIDAILDAAGVTCAAAVGSGGIIKTQVEGGTGMNITWDVVPELMAVNAVLGT